MALTAKEKERIDKLDFAKGGGFSDFITDRQKLPPADSKFLFLGLGGKGSSTVAGIKTGVYQKIICNEDTKRPVNFEYLAIDTDVEELEDLVKGKFGEIGLSGAPADAETCQLYDNTAAKRLSPDKRHEIQEHILEWLSPTMNQELQGKGAGGIRQAGRYLLFGDAAFNMVRNSLSLKLRRLHGQITNTAAQDLIVYIFAGVGGGTGSGTIIDVPYIIREICRQNNWKVKIYSYIFLPDTYPEEARRQTHVKYNSYAALKEIDTLMNIGQMDGTAHFRAKYASDFSVNSKERIFDSCVLVSGKRTDGMVEYPDSFSRKVVVDNIINLVTQNVTDNGFLANSFLDNSSTMIQNAVGHLPDATVPKNAYYQYTVIGTGTLVLPIEQVFAYMAYGTMEMLSNAWDKHAKQNHVEELLSRIQMKPQELSGAIKEKSQVPMMKYTNGIGGTVNKTQVIDDTLFNIIKQIWLGQNVALYDAWDKAKNIWIEFIISQLRESYYGMFKDEEKGIYYLQELLSYRVIDGQEFNGIYQRVTEEYTAAISGFISGEQQIQVQIDQKMREIKEKLDAPFCFFSNKLIEEYRELCVNRLVCDNMIYMYDVIVRDCLKQIRGFLRNKMDDLQDYVDVFTYMREIIERNYQSVMEGKRTQAEYFGKLVDFSQKNDEATQKIVAFMDSMLSSKKPEGLATALEARIIDTEEKWKHSREKFNPMSVFVNFLEEQYDEVPNLTIEKFIKIKYGEDGFATGMQSVCQELKNKAEVIFPAGTIISLQTLATKTYVVVPAGALDITSNMSAFAAANGATVAQSNDMNSMFWYNLIIGVPLFLLDDIAEYEELYEKNDISGMHCWESPSVNWKEWPALNNQVLWRSPNVNRREKKYALQVQQDVKDYLSCGLIYQDETTGLYYAYCMPDDNSDITKETVVEWCQNVYLASSAYDNEDKIDSGKKLVKEMVSAQDFIRYLVKIPSVYMMIDDESLYKLIRMNVFLYHKLRNTYTVYEECRKVVEKKNEEHLSGRTRLINMQRFYDYCRTGIIQISSEAVFLEDRDHVQKAIMYFEDYNKLDNRFYIYTAFQCFIEKFKEDYLKEIDEYRKELSDDRSTEARERYKKLSDHLIDECIQVRDSLKKLDVRNELEKYERGHMLSIYADFYGQLILMRKGK